MRKAILIIGFLFLSLSLSNLAKADVAKGAEAYKQGDYETALKEWLIDANQGDALAQYNVGFMYENGYGVPKNNAEAVRWWYLAANQGHAGAQYNLGVMYGNGTGVTEDFIFGYMWTNLAAAQGHEEAKGNKEVFKEWMTAEQIAEAQRLSAEWLEEHQ